MMSLECGKWWVGHSGRMPLPLLGLIDVEEFVGAEEGLAQVGQGLMFRRRCGGRLLGGRIR